MADALSNLKDIHLPPPIGFWPPAYGWFIITALILMLVVVALKRYMLYRKKRHLKQEALSRIEAIRQQSLQNSNMAESAADISILLKQIALMRYPRVDVAAITQEQWLLFLNTHPGDVDFTPVKSLLLEAPYQAEATGDINTLIKLATHWIKRQLS
jgi:hypothetical protein